MAASDVLRGMSPIFAGLVVAGAMSIAVAPAQQDPAALQIQRVKDLAHILDSHDPPFSRRGCELGGKC